MLIGLAAMTGFSWLILFTHSVVIAAGVGIALGASFSLVTNGAIPFALALVPDKAGLGIGIYFGGALASSMFGFGRLGTIPPTVGILIGAIAFSSWPVYRCE